MRSRGRAAVLALLGAVAALACAPPLADPRRGVVDAPVRPPPASPPPSASSAAPPTPAPGLTAPPTPTPGLAAPDTPASTASAPPPVEAAPVTTPEPPLLETDADVLRRIGEQAQRCFAGSKVDVPAGSRVRLTIDTEIRPDGSSANVTLVAAETTEQLQGSGPADCVVRAVQEQRFPVGERRLLRIPVVLTLAP